MLALGEWFANLDSGTVKLIVIFCAAALVGIVAVLAHAWRCARESDNRAQITAMMLERNMSTDEIERILMAGVGAAAVADAAAKAAEPDDEVRLIKQLADLSYDGGDVEKILKAARVDGRIEPRTARIVEGLANNWMEADDIVRVLGAHTAQRGGEFDPSRLGDALREKGFSQQQIELVLAKSV